MARAAIVSEFADHLRSLTLAVVRYYPGDADVARMRDRVRLALDYAPADALETVGPYLFKYQAQIDGPGFDWRYDPGDFPDAAAAAAFVPRLQALVPRLSEAERADYKETAQALLSLYLEYRILVQ